MVEIRIAKKGEEIRQKEIWKLCFGDEASYIDFYFDHKYKKEETAVLLYNGQIAAMATMVPAKIISPSGECFEVAMLYAVATHPSYQGKGFSTQIMAFCHKHLIKNGVEISILVPAEPSLFEFYAKIGYETAFYHEELTLTYDRISAFKKNLHTHTSIKPLEASKYNEIRKDLLKGNLYVDYYKNDINYQKKVSKVFGADLYEINSGQVKGCAMVERIDQTRVLIKEILMPDGFIQYGLAEVAKLLPAEEYIVRLPACQEGELGGTWKPFGMIKCQGDKLREMSGEPVYKESGYLGVAHD